MDDRALIRRLGDRFLESSFTLVFTGAGISTGSGIPDFRGPQGLWRTWRPVYLDEFLSSHAARIRHWEFKLASWQRYRDAEPNPAHRALVELERLGLLQMVVTQNIDGLHQKAGHSPERLVELHGTNLKVHCVSCSSCFDPEGFYAEFERSHEPPVCPRCGGWTKPATVSFGQQMPEESLSRAMAAARDAHLVVAVGSTLEVQPAASVPLAAKAAGAVYAILNQGPTAQDHLADLRLEGDATVLFPELLAELRSRR